MRQLKQIMLDLGLTKDRPESTKRALVRHLTRAAEQLSPQKDSAKTEQKIQDSEQLSFDEDILAGKK